MDPVTLATAAGTGVAKGIGSIVGKQVADQLKRKTHRIRVARAVAKAAKTRGIIIRSKDLRRWLGSTVVLARFEADDPASRLQCISDLEGMVSTAGSGPANSSSGQVLLELIRDEALRKLPNDDAHVEAVRRNAVAIRDSEQRILAHQGDAVAFAHALSRLHPWRRGEAEELANRWSPLRQVVITLAASAERSSLLNQWAANPPVDLQSAPAEVWSWLGVVAADYGASESAVLLMEAAINRGAPASYWWAFAGLTIGNATPSSASRARDLWRRSEPPHALAIAALAIDNERYADAEGALEQWHPDQAKDQVLKAILQISAATGLNEFNRAIGIGLACSKEHPEASGIALRTAEALLSRGHLGVSDNPLEDFARSYELAVQARDSRRTWLGDSVAAILVAVKAKALATDADLAWRLTQATPDGSALPDESSDPRLRREAAILAAHMGRFELAKQLAGSLGDEFAIRTVEGWEAYAQDDTAVAEAAWLAAWDLAPNDQARAQTASALAPLGRTLPDLSIIADTYSEALKRIRAVHRVMSADGDRLSLLRAHSSESEQITVILAERLVAEGDYAGAGTVLEAGGSRFGQPLLTSMAAERYLSAGDYARAEQAAQSALDGGGQTWGGRLEASRILFNALEAQGKSERTLAIARDMATIAPNNPSVRWTLVHCLVRRGDAAAAWAALSHDGSIAAPRDAEDARTWIGLAAAFDDSPRFVQRALEMMANWAHDPDVTGIFLAQIYGGLTRHKSSVAQADVEELHRATAAYMLEHPESGVFRGFTIDEEDPLASITEELRRQAEPPQLRELRLKVQAGELPLGVLAEVLHRSYIELSIRRGAGLVYCHSPAQSTSRITAAEAARNSVVVVDGSVPVTLSLFDSAVVDHLWGAFLSVETTDRVYRDALSAQQSLGLRSTMTLGWNPDEDRPELNEISEEIADALARHADRVVTLLTRSTRRGWPGLKEFAEFGGEGHWLSALDYAAANKLPFWCDDRLLRQVAADRGLQTFGTVDLLSSLEDSTVLSSELAVATRATLIHNFHVDLGFSAPEMHLAAEMAAWNPHGAAAAMSRPAAWVDPAKAMTFVCDAIARVASTSPSAVQGWVCAAATGLIAGRDHHDGSNNLRLFLTDLMAQPWLRPDVLPFVVDGIRGALGADSPVRDPLRPVLETMFRAVGREHGAPAAAEFLLMMVAALGERDRAAAANVILTTND